MSIYKSSVSSLNRLATPIAEKFYKQLQEKGEARFRVSLLNNSGKKNLIAANMLIESGLAKVKQKRNVGSDAVYILAPTNNFFKKNKDNNLSRDSLTPSVNTTVDSDEKESQLNIEPLPFNTEDGELNFGPPNEDYPPKIFRQSSHERRFLAWVNSLYELTDEPDNVNHNPANLDRARPQHEYSLPTYISEEEDDDSMPVTITPFMKGKKIFFEKFTNDGDLIGEMTLELEPDGETWRVSFINVRKKYRGKGYSKELHDAADEWAKENNAWITPDNDITDDARRIWHKKRISPGYTKEPYQRKKPYTLRTHLDVNEVQEGEEYELLDPVPEEYIPQELKYRYRRANHFQNSPIKQLKEFKVADLNMEPTPEISQETRNEFRKDHYLNDNEYPESIMDNKFNWRKT